MNNKLVAVVCGMPFSGTTFLSRIICSHPNIDSGFECGILFEDSPMEFPKRKKFYNWMMSNEKPYNWKLSEEEMTYICNTDNFYTSYHRIIEKCHLFNGTTANKIIDKTPAYVYRLRNIMSKVKTTPFIVIKKEPLFQYYSYKNRSRSVDEFVNLYNKQFDSIQRIINRPILNKRLLIISFEDLQQNLDFEINKIFTFLCKHSDLEFGSSMIEVIKTNLNTDVKSNVKKLRKKFDYTVEKEKFMKTFTEFELEQLSHLRELPTSVKS